MGMSYENSNPEKETEQSLLNEIVIGHVDFGEVQALGLTAKDFSTETYRLLYKAMKRLHDRNEPIDPLAVYNELEGVERPDGGAWSQCIVNTLGTSIPLDDVAFHVNQLKQASHNRQLSEAAYRLYEAAERGDSERVQKLTEKITELQALGAESDTGAKCIALAHHEPKPKPWVIEALLPDEFPSMIYGAGGIGKSFISTYLGIEACRGGQSFMGYSFPREPLNTLIIDYELDADVQAERAQKVARGLNLTGIPENLHYYAPTKAAARALPEFRGLIKRHDIRFVIIDSWGASGVDGGNPEDTTAFLAELRNLGIATLTLDHQAKIQTGENYDNKTAFGSVYKFNMCRSVFQLSKIGDEKNPMTLQLRHKKSNFGPLVDDLVFDVCFEGDRVLFTQSSAPNPEDRDLKLIAETIMELEADRGRVNAKSVAESLEGIISRDRVYFLLKHKDGGLWESRPGDRKERLYKSKILKPGPIYTQDFRILENSSNDEDLPSPPDELF